MGRPQTASLKPSHRAPNLADDGGVDDDDDGDDDDDDDGHHRRHRHHHRRHQRCGFGIRLSGFTIVELIVFSFLRRRFLVPTDDLRRT